MHKKERALKDQRSLNDLLLLNIKENVHGRYFPEEYDYVYDSSVEAKDRKRSINPMSQEYTDKVNARRAKLGVSPLGPDGQAQDRSSDTFASKVAKEQMDKANEQLTSYLSEALYELDPANTCCKQNGCSDEYELIAQSIIAAEKTGVPVSVAIKRQMVAAFGNDTFDYRTLNTLSDSVIQIIAANIAKNEHIESILMTMERLRNTQPQTINGARGAQMYYKELHNRLDKLGYEGKRPPSKLSHPPMRRGKEL